MQETQPAGPDYHLTQVAGAAALQAQLDRPHHERMEEAAEAGHAVKAMTPTPHTQITTDNLKG